MAIHRRFRRIPTEKKRLLLLFFALMMLAVTVFAAWIVSRTSPEADVSTPLDTSVQLTQYTAAEVASITIRRGSEAPWTAENTADSSLVLQGKDGFALTSAESADLLDAARVIMAGAVLTDTPADYSGHLADFGLESPELEARIRYTDGMEVVLHVGDKGPDGTWRYMLIDGDDRLFAFSNGAVDALFVNRDTLRKVSQPVLHKARIDRITLTEGENVIQWALNGSITDPDAIDKWHITAPFAYPASAAAMEQLLSSLSNLRLSAYVAPATAENLTLYGFDAPRLTIELHQAAGTIATTTSEGAAEATDYPESTVTYVIGGEKSDMIDYVHNGDGIYLSSHFTMGVFMGYDVHATMSRYPVLTALGNLASLVITDSSGTREYVLTRMEQVAPNNDLITDEDGNPVYDVTVTCNEENVEYAAFETAYNALALVTVSGVLPTDTALTADPHTVYTFTDVDGTVHTVALATFDALHDAVIVDGNGAFYLIKGGFTLHLD